jgi:uncharacterized membrane-anchored protein
MKYTDLYMIILGSIIVIGFFALVGVLIFIPIKESNQNILYMVAGGLMGGFMNIIGYYFGSSNGSKMKTEMMDRNSVKKESSIVIDNYNRPDVDAFG